jgi:chemotaxis protein MotB
VAVGGYFRDPSGTARKVGSNMTGSGENFSLTKDNMPKLKEELEKDIRQMSDLSKLQNQIEMTVTSEGLRIELLEAESETFFESGSSHPTDSGKELLVLLAKELERLPNKISIEGHTDSKPFTGRHDYGNWELSSDRANAARRLMQQSGLRPDQVSQVRGYADQKLRRPAAPEDPSNRRISVIVQYIPKDEDEKPGSAGQGVDTGAKPSTTNEKKAKE